MTRLRLSRGSAGMAAAMALLAAACGDDVGGTDGGSATPSTVEVTGTDALRFDPDVIEAAAGTVTVELAAGEAVEHTFVIEELDDTEVVAVAAGETATGTVELEPGTYTFYCDVPGHRDAGMEGELTVAP